MYDNLLNFLSMVHSNKHDIHFMIQIMPGRIVQSVTCLASAVGNVSGYRCVSDCRSRGRKFDPGSVPYFRGD